MGKSLSFSLSQECWAAKISPIGPEAAEIVALLRGLNMNPNAVLVRYPHFFSMKGIFLLCDCVVNKNVVACTAGRLEPQKVMQALCSGCDLACMQGVHVPYMGAQSVLYCNVHSKLSVIMTRQFASCYIDWYHDFSFVLAV